MKKTIINQKYFDKPIGSFKNKLKLKHFNFFPMEISCEKPCIFLTPNVSKIDRNLISKCLKSNFVFIKDEAIQNISSGTFDEKQCQELLQEITSLAGLGLSFSVIWGKHPSVFGKNEKLSESLCMFLKETKLDIKFLTFPNEFFAIPTWGTTERKTKIYASQKLSVKARGLIGLSKKDVVDTFHKNTPSSATSYTNKFPVDYASNNIAEGLEKVVYVCPNCKKLFSLYSEFSCLKCKDCGNAFEIDKNAQILFSPKFNNFDEIEKFQFNQLKRYDFDINPLIQYDKITQIFVENCKKQVKIVKILQIYAEKLILINPLTKKKNEYYFEDIDDAIFTHDNGIIIKQKNANQFQIFGNNNENLLIIRDLLKINKN